MITDQRRTWAIVGAAIAPLVLVAFTGVPVLVVPALMLLWCVLGYLSPTAMLAAIAFAIPLYHQPLETTDGSFIPSELMLVSTAAAIGLLQLKRILLASGNRIDQLIDLVREILANRLALFAAAFAIIAVLPFFFPVDTFSRVDALREWRWVLVWPLIFIVLLSVQLRTFSEVRTLAIAYIAGAVAGACSGLLDPILGGGVQAEGLTRLDGFFPHPNSMALYLLRATIFLGFLTVWKVRTNRWAVTALAILSLALCGTFARSALSTGAIFLVVASLWLPRPFRFATWSAIGATFVGLFVFARERMLGGVDGGSQILRIDIWQSGLAMIRDNPVTGLGPDQFLYAYAPRYIHPEAWAERFTSHAHNLLLDSWIRLGIGGEILMLVAIGIVAWRVVQVLRNGPAGEPLAAAAILALGAAIIQGMVDNGFFAHDVAMSAWLLAWIGFVAPSRHQDGEGLTNASSD